jgi:ssDNA-binding Zn-finger/Zn-ribbon topoisomerase 1
MTETRCPQCDAQIDMFWNEGIQERWFVYCTECKKIVTIKKPELSFSEYTAPLCAIAAN